MSTAKTTVTPPASLLHLETFLNQVFQGEQPVSENPELGARCGELVLGNARMSPADQVDVYREQFWLRHRDSLIEDYPGLQQILGEDPFERFARAYLDAFPPKTPSLRDLGADILGFAETYPFPAELRTLALDSIRYELAFVDAFDGPDPKPLDATIIASMPPEAWNEAVIVLNPCVARMRLEYPVHRLRYAVKSGEEAPPMEPVPGGLRIALFRRLNVVRFEELSPAAFQLLDALGRGVPLVPACAEVTQGKTESEVATIEASIGGWFSEWARGGFIADIVPPAAKASP